MKKLVRRYLRSQGASGIFKVIHPLSDIVLSVMLYYIFRALSGEHNFPAAIIAAATGLVSYLVQKENRLAWVITVTIANQPNVKKQILNVLYLADYWIIRIVDDMGCLRFLCVSEIEQEIKGKGRIFTRLSCFRFMPTGSRELLLEDLIPYDTVRILKGGEIKFNSQRTKGKIRPININQDQITNLIQGEVSIGELHCKYRGRRIIDPEHKKKIGTIEGMKEIISLYEEF